MPQSRRKNAVVRIRSASAADNIQLVKQSENEVQILFCPRFSITKGSCLWKALISFCQKTHFMFLLNMSNRLDGILSLAAAAIKDDFLSCDGTSTTILSLENIVNQIQNSGIYESGTTIELFASCAGIWGTSSPAQKLANALKITVYCTSGISLYLGRRKLYSKRIRRHFICWWQSLGL